MTTKTLEQIMDDVLVQAYNYGINHQFVPFHRLRTEIPKAVRQYAAGVLTPERKAELDQIAKQAAHEALGHFQPAERPNGAPDTAPMYKALIEAKIALSVVNSGASIHVISLIDAVLNAAPTQSTQQPDATVYVDAGDLRQVLNGNDMPASMSAEPQPGMVALYGAQQPDAGEPVLIYQARQYIHPEGRWVDTNRAEYDLFGDMPDRIERRIVYTNPVPQAEVAQTAEGEPE